MSDLIEKLEAYYQKGHDAKSQNAAMIYEDKFRELCWAAAPEILTALRTLQRIEGLAIGHGVGVVPPMPPDNEWWISHKGQIFKGKTLPLAVEAAVGASEKGGK